MSAAPTSRRRPALWTALGFAAGVAGAHYAHPALGSLCIFSVLLFVAALGWWLVDEGRVRARALLLLGLVGALGALRYQVHTQLWPPHHIARAALFGRQGLFEGRIVEEPERGEDGARVVVELEGARIGRVRHRLSGRVLLRARGVEINAAYGDCIALRGRLRRPQPARNPGAFDYRAFLARRNIHGLLSLRRRQLAAVRECGGDAFYTGVILPVRRAVRRTIRRNLSGAPAGLLQGVLLGEKQRIPRALRERFRRTGLAHALVISGLHVGLIAAFFFGGFKLARLPQRPASAATVLVLIFYAFLTRLQAPVVRAAIMVGVVLAGRLVGRAGEVYNSLGLAALLILVLWPASLFSLSFQLSFGAVLAIVGLYPSIAAFFPRAWRREDRRVGRWIVAPLCVSAAAQIGTGPLVAYYFQYFAPIGLVANLAAVPLLGAVVALGILSALSGWFLAPVATAFNGANYLVIKALLWMVDFFAALPLASVQTPHPGWGFVLWAGLMVFLLARWHQGPGARKAALLALLLGLNGMVWSRARRERKLEVVFLDVGQGDAAFVRFPGGRTMIVDGGGRSPEFDEGARVVLPFLRYRHIERVDLVVASHPHNDHIGGLVSLLEEVEVGNYIDGGQRYDSRTAGRLRELIAARGIRYHAVAAGDTLLGLGGVGGLVLHPTGAFVDSAGTSLQGVNNGSVVLRLNYGEVNLLFAGDIERETDAAMLAWGERLRARVLKVAHHGSPTSSQPPFVAAVRPEVAVVSVGAFNRFHHPAPEVMARYRESGARVYRTDRFGALILETDGKSMDLRTMLHPGPSGAAPRRASRRRLRRTAKNPRRPAGRRASGSVPGAGGRRGGSGPGHRRR